MYRLLLLLRRAFFNSLMNGAFGLAKAAAYSGLLSLFPLLSAIAAILVQANAEAVSNYLAQFLFEFVPPGTAEMVEYQFTSRGERPLWLLIGALLISAWAAASLMESLMDGFRAAYRIPAGRGIVKDRMFALLMVFLTAIPAIVGSALLIFGQRVEQEILSAFGVEREGVVAFLSSILRFAFSFIAVMFNAALMYYFAPNRPMRWHYVWPGAFAATLLWLIVTLLFGWYVRNLADYNVMYGSVGGVIAMLVWMYLLAFIALFGCEFNAEYERLARAR